MVKYDEIKLSYTSPAFPPEGIFMDKAYTIGKDKKGLFITDGNYIEYIKENNIKALFTPLGVKWEQVDFSDRFNKIADKTI